MTLFTPKYLIPAKSGAYRQFLHPQKRRLPGCLAKWLGVQIQTGSLLLMLSEDSKIPWWLGLRLGTQVINTREKKNLPINPNNLEISNWGLQFSAPAK
jgi:hypothetical protein